MADLIAVMVPIHRWKPSARFPPHVVGKPIVHLDVADDFGCMGGHWWRCAR